MLEVTIDTLDDIFTDMNARFGARVKRGYMTLRSSPQDEKSIEELSRRIHPVGRWLYDLALDIERSKQESRLMLGVTSYSILELYNQITQVGKLPGADRIIEKLDHEDQFAGARYELNVAYEHQIHGWNVEVIPESKVKSPDLKVTRGDTSVYIECKSLEDKRIRANQAWDYFALRIDRLAQSLGYQLRLKIEAQGFINLNEADALFSSLRQKLQPHRTFSSICHGHKVSIFWGPKYDVYQPIDSFRFAIGEQGRVSFESKIEESGHFIAQLVIVDVVTYFSTEFEGAAKKQYRNARDQLKEVECGDGDFRVLHMEVPHDTAESFSVIVSSLYALFESRINKPESALNAIVISTKNERYQSFKESIFRPFDHVIIPGAISNTLSELNADFELLGAGVDDSLKDVIHHMVQNPNEGTLIFEITLAEQLFTCVGSYIVRVVSAFGRHQLKISVLNQSVWCFEVITPSVGRLSVNFDVAEVIKRNSRNKIAICFSKSGLKAAINGTLLLE